MSWPNWADEWPVDASSLRVVLFWNRVDGPSDTGNVAFTASDGWRMDHLLGRAVNALRGSDKILPWMKHRAVTGLQYLGRGDRIEKVSWKEARSCPVRDFSHSAHLAIIRLDFDATKLKFLPGVCFTCRVCGR